MAFSTANLEQKLSQVTETQESITNLSQWVLFRKRQVVEVAQVWSRYITTCPENLKLGLVYVANEVVQQARIKGRTEFIDAWSRILPDALSQVYNQVPSQVQDRIKRVINVWRDRKIFDPEVIKQIEASTGSGPSFFSGDKRPAAPSSSGPAVPDKLAGLFKAWNRLEEFKMPNVRNPLKPELEASLKFARAEVASLGQVQEQIELLSQEVQSRKAEFAKNIQHLQDVIKACTPDPDELPSPALEPDSEPEVYTANQAQDEESDDEHESKKSKVDLDPKLMSFLANMQ